MDANTEFAAPSIAADFLNSSMGFSPTILSFPTYPDPRPGLNVSRGTPRCDLRARRRNLLDSAGSLMILEPARNWSIGTREYGGRASVGYWWLDSDSDRFDGSHSHGTDGFYSLLEQSFWRRSVSVEPTLSGFLQLGWQTAGSVLSRNTSEEGSYCMPSGPVGSAILRELPQPGEVFQRTRGRLQAGGRTDAGVLLQGGLQPALCPGSRLSIPPSSRRTARKSRSSRCHFPPRDLLLGHSSR